MPFSIHTVSPSDPIIFQAMIRNHGVSLFSQQPPHLTHASANLLLSLSWTLLLKPRFAHLLKEVQAYKAQRPLHRLVFLTNMGEEKKLLDAHNLHN